MDAELVPLKRCFVRGSLETTNGRPAILRTD
jgi:hypothetical protein